MALIKCPSCGASISDRAHRCPKCSSIVPNTVRPKPTPIANQPVYIPEEPQFAEEDEPRRSPYLRVAIFLAAVFVVGILAFFLIGKKGKKAEEPIAQLEDMLEAEAEQAPISEDNYEIGVEGEAEAEDEYCRMDDEPFDLPAFEAKGRVKSLTYKGGILPFTDNQTVKFDENGRWINYDNAEEILGFQYPGMKGVTTHDGEGRISKWKIKFAGNDENALEVVGDIHYDFTWDGDNLVNIQYYGYEEGASYDLKYNHGLKGINIYAGGLCEDYIYTYELLNVKTDRHNNWTERTWKRLFEYTYDTEDDDYLYIKQDADGYGTPIFSVDSTIIKESRIIEYY